MEYREREAEQRIQYLTDEAERKLKGNKQSKPLDYIVALTIFFTAVYLILR